MLFMVIETFRDNDVVPVYRRFRDAGRGLPDGLEYLARATDGQLTVDKLLDNFESGASFLSQVIPLARPMR